MNGPEGVLCVSYETRSGDVYEAAVLMDRKNKVNIRRAVEGVALALVALMYIPPQAASQWVMLGLCAATGLLLWQFPQYSNRRFAGRKQENCPRYEILFREDGAEVYDSQSREFFAYSGKFDVCEGPQVFALLFKNNRVVALPKDQAGEGQVQALRALFREKLGGRFAEMKL